MSQSPKLPQPELAGQTSGYTPPLAGRFPWLTRNVVLPLTVDSTCLALGAAHSITGLRNRGANMTWPLRRDYANSSPTGRAMIGGAAVLSAANYSQIRTALSLPFELEVAHATNPVIAGVAGAAIHWAWFWSYSHALRKASAELPRTVARVASGVPVEKLKLPGLEPGSTMPSTETVHPAKRLAERAWLRNRRRLAMKMTTTMAYIALSAMQKQSPEDQKQLCTETTNEGAAAAFLKTVAVTGVVALVGRNHPQTAESIVSFSQTMAGRVACVLGSFCLIAGPKAIKKGFKGLYNHLHQPGDETAPRPRQALVKGTL